LKPVLPDPALRRARDDPSLGAHSDGLRAVARKLLLDSPDFKQLMTDLGG
jgi:hypothetical protein